MRVLERIKAITAKEPIFIQGDIRDEELMARSMIGCNALRYISAGLKAVGESSADTYT